MFEIGIYNFGEITPNPVTGKMASAGERIQQLLEQAEAADKAGLDVFALGEHHRGDFAVSAPTVVLAAAAERTKKIRLSTSVSILSSDDPVRVYQQHATLDLISKGRAEMMVGRGSYTESFPLFGYSLGDYDDLFEEKLRLLMEIQDNNPISWKGRFRPPLKNADIAPRPERKLPLWVAVGGAPASVARAAQLKLPLALAIIGGEWRRFRPFTDLYRKTSSLPIGINTPGFVAKTAGEVYEIGFPYFAKGWMENFHERHHGIKVTKETFAAQSGPEGALFFGTVDEIVEKIVAQHKVFGHQRFMMQLGFGNVPQEEALKSIELLGKEVAPRVRKLVQE
ncbi:MAG TPA: LLM class flavin-dependent oxidoreductase [Candidatus Bilamarchaeum sp.]|nr:LLM class flavin-dependent oxidoreductase [Candidatus Bilamarchaeum sp.]